MSGSFHHTIAGPRPNSNRTAGFDQFLCFSRQKGRWEGDIALLLGPGGPRQNAHHQIQASMKGAQQFFGPAGSWKEMGTPVPGDSAQLVLAFGGRHLLETQAPYDYLKAA